MVFVEYQQFSLVRPRIQATPAAPQREQVARADCGVYAPQTSLHNENILAAQLRDYP